MDHGFVQIMGLEGENVHRSSSGWSPVFVEDNLAVMSVGFLLPSTTTAVIWRGPKKNGLIKQFLKDVEWGEIDYLVVDTPPGTSDEHLSLVQVCAYTVVQTLSVRWPSGGSLCSTVATFNHLALHHTKDGVCYLVVHVLMCTY